jgi:hypothetical protein
LERFINYSPQVPNHAPRSVDAAKTADTRTSRLPPLRFAALPTPFLLPTRWLKIGQANGNAPEQEIKSGDTVIVREVDKWYLANGDAFPGCDCPAEKYAVYAYVEMGNTATRVQLLATTYKPQNVDTCGTSPGSSLLGCGTTERRARTPMGRLPDRPYAARKVVSPVAVTSAFTVP